MPEVMTVREAAAALRVSDQTVWRYVKNGMLSGKKVGRQYLIPTEEVEALREPPKRQPPDDGTAVA